MTKARGEKMSDIPSKPFDLERSNPELNNLIQMPHTGRLTRESHSTLQQLPELRALLKQAPSNPERNFDGPISKAMWQKVSALKSSYPDTFNWGVYDQIYNRFAHNQPRGGVVFKTTFKLVNFHATCTKCYYSFEIDAYGRGCIHECQYCYAKVQLTSHGFWNRPMPFPVDLAEVRKIFHTVFETNKPNKWRSVMLKRIPLRIGSMSDSFMWMDNKYRITYELLKILNYYKYPYIIFTRSDLVAHDDYLNILDKKLASVQMSIVGNNEHLTRLLEPGAPSVKRRLAALKKLNEAGLWTTVRINPMFPIYPDGYLSNPDSVIKRFGSLEAAPKFDLFDWSMLDQLKEAQVPSFLAGFVRLSMSAINNIQKATGIDFKTFFSPDQLATKGDKRYSDSEIRAYYVKLKEEASKRGIRFSTCYIGNGEKDYYQYQDLWDNKTDCCDARGNIPQFKTSSQMVPWSERIKHAPCKQDALKAQDMTQKLETKFSKIHSEQIQHELSFRKSVGLDPNIENTDTVVT